MGSWGYGPMDSDHAADIMHEILEFIESKYFTDKRPKDNLRFEELLAIGQIFWALNKAGGICRPEQLQIENLIVAIKSRRKDESRKWNIPGNFRRSVRGLINRLVRML